MEFQGNHEHKEKHDVETQSHIRSILLQLETTNIELQNINREFPIQGPHHQGFNSVPRNFYILKIDMNKS